MKTQKLFLSLLLIVFCATQMSAYTLYYYNADDYKYAVWNWKDGVEGIWSSWMTPVSGHEGWYQTDIDDERDKVIFVAFGKSISLPDWKDKVYQTTDLTYDGVHAYYIEGDGWTTIDWDTDEDPVYSTSGSCGDNLTWSLDTLSGILTIEGSGYMSYPGLTPGESIPSAPWKPYALNIKQVSLPEGLLNIPSIAFSACENLTTINFPNSIVRIGEAVFPNGITSILYNSQIFAYLPRTFQGEYSIPEQIEIIAIGAFASCNSLTSLRIPSTVTKIDYYAFYNTINLKSIFNYSSAPQNIDNTVFADALYATCTLYVPKEYINWYKVHSVWGHFAQIKAIEDVLGIDEVSSHQVRSTKYIVNGQVLVDKNGKTYTITGQEVK